MEKFDLETENTKLIDNSNMNLIEIKRLIAFMKIFVENFNLIISNFQKQLANPQQILYESILITNMNGMYNYFLSIMENSGNLMNRIVNDIISPLEQFLETQTSIYKDNLSRLGNLIGNYNKCKTLLNYSKNNYYYSSNEYYKFKNKNQGLIHLNKDLIDKSIQMKSKVNANELLYKYEVEKYNIIISKFNVLYKQLNDDVKSNEESRISFLKATIDRFKIIYEEFTTGLVNYKNIIENYSSDDICEKDKKYFNHEITKYYRGKTDRLQNEKFISFNEYIPQNPNLNDIVFENVYNEIKLFPLLKEEEENKFINLIINELLKENEIQISNITKALEQMKNQESSFAKKLLDNFLDKKKVSSSLKFTNLKNMEHFSNILCFISTLNDNINDPNFPINFKIIFLAERIFYQNKTTGDKIYLCAQLSKNKYFRTKRFWENVIELKLASKLEDHIERLKNLILPEEKNSKGGLFGKFLGGKNDIHKTSIVGVNKISKLLKNYNTIEDSKVPIIDRMATNELISIIRENIPSFCNFNFYPDECLEMINDFTRKYNINKEYITFFFSYFSVSNFTVRKLLPNEDTYTFKKNKFKKNYSQEQKYLVLISESLKYLNKSDYLNLLLLSKKSNKKLSKKIYKIILTKKDTSIKTRLNIWNNILGISELKKKYNYQEMLNSPCDEKVSLDIKLDVLRTNFKNEQNEEAQNKISNVLNSVAKLNGEIKYCQGMNYIVSFLLEILSEEEAFYIFLSFFQSTEYPLIFEKDLEKLQSFFYIFQRLISLFEPELSILFNANGVNANIFLPPWFITLFLSSRQYMNQSDTPIALIRILDNFIVGGWKSLMKVGIFVLHFCEEEIKNLKYENMLSYLNNDIKKYNLFIDDKIPELEKCFDDKRITKNLIKFIEDEYKQENKIKELKL